MFQTDYNHLYIDGTWGRPAGTSRLEVINPATEERAGSVPEGTPADIDAAVSAARRAFDGGDWPAMSPAERAGHLSQVVKLLRDRSEDIAEAITTEMGCPITFARRGQTPGVADTLEYYMSLAETFPFEQLRGDGSNRALVIYQPVGVVGAIVPWNFPLVSLMVKLAPALITVEYYIGLGQQEGAKPVVGGGRPNELPRGYYVEPTIFAGVDNSMRISQEEIFGPVITITTYPDLETGVAIANDSMYGLSGGVYTRDASHGVEVARRIRTGVVRVNGAAAGNQAPFGGFKSSGIGREKGPEAIGTFSEIKAIPVPADYQPAQA